jgi:hypothetical protein
MIAWVRGLFFKEISMSHLVSITTQVRDSIAIQSACERLKLPAPVFGKARLFTSEATGWQVKLPDWLYPVVCDTNQGDVKFNNFGGRWGNQSHLDAFLQAYAVEKAKLEARKQGHSVSEQQLADGSIRVQIALAG